jgi:putative peptidoglycan lipid II flippase
MGVLNSLRRFAAPAAAPIFLNLGIIAAAYGISPFCPEPIVGIAIGVCIGGALQVALQLPSVFRAGFRLVPRWQPRHPDVLRIGRLMLPAIFGSAVYQVNQFIGTLLASFLPGGSISWLYYADRLVQFPLGVFAIAISTAALPSLSNQAADKDTRGFAQTLRHALCLVFFITFPSMVGLMILGRPMIQVFFQRGAFGVNATLMTHQALFCYAAGLWAFSAIRVLVSGFYALQDTKTPVKVATAALGANVLFSLALMGPMQHAGLALALALSSSLQMALLYGFLKRRIQPGVWQSIASSVWRSAAAATAMGTCIHFLHRKCLPTTPDMPFVQTTIRLFLLIGAGVLIYLAAARALRCPELQSLSGLTTSLAKRLGFRRQKKKE